MAHDLDAIPMQDGVEVGGVGRGEGACHGVPLFPFWFWVANATLAFAESGVCKRQAPSQGPEKQRGLRALRGKPRLSFWVEGA